MKCFTLALSVALAAQAQAQALYREKDGTGNVVMRGGDLTLRFYAEYGGTPLSWYKAGYPVLTNEFPGSGASVAWRSGQDPTQASANGILKNPISRFDDPSTQRYAYYISERRFDPSAGVYQVDGFLPDFWLSSEAPDDAIAPNVEKTDNGWRTPYAPGKFAATLALPSRPVIFESTPTARAGLFFPADEANFGSAWASRLRRYEVGRVAFKIQISLAGAGDDAIAGVMFRKNVPTDAASRFDGYMAPGLTLAVNKHGGWGLTRMNPHGGETTIDSGTLTATQLARLKGDGLQLEVRTDNNQPDLIEIWFDDALAKVVRDPAPLTGPHLALFASTSSGFVTFGNRAVYDVGVKFSATYSIWDQGIVSDVTVQSADGVRAAHAFDRANLPAVFLNTATFPEDDRRIALFNGQGVPLTEIEPASYPIWGQYGFWAGNKAGTVGLLAIPEIILVDGQPGLDSHCFLKPKTEGGEFVLMLNPLPPEVESEVKTMRLRVRWQARIP